MAYFESPTTLSRPSTKLKYTKMVVGGWLHAGLHKAVPHNWYCTCELKFKKSKVYSGWPLKTGVESFCSGFLIKNCCR